MISGCEMYTFTETTLMLINPGKVYFQAFKIGALLRKHWGKQTDNFFLKAGEAGGGGGGIKREFTVAAHEKATLAYLRIKLF